MDNIKKESFTREDLQQLTKVTVQLENVMAHLHKITETIDKIEANQRKQELDIQDLKTQVAALCANKQLKNHPLSTSTLYSFFSKNWYYVLALCGSGVVGWVIDHLYWLHHLK